MLAMNSVNSLISFSFILGITKILNSQSLFLEFLPIYSTFLKTGLEWAPVKARKSSSLYAFMSYVMDV